MITEWSNPNDLVTAGFVGGNWVGAANIRDDDTSFAYTVQGAVDTASYIGGNTANYGRVIPGGTPIKPTVTINELRVIVRTRRSDGRTGSMLVRVELVGDDGTFSLLDWFTITGGGGPFTTYTIEGDAAFWGMTQEQLISFCNDFSGTSFVRIRPYYGLELGWEIEYLTTQVNYTYDPQLRVFPALTGL